MTKAVASVPGIEIEETMEKGAEFRSACKDGFTHGERGFRAVRKTPDFPIKAGSSSARI
jgi:hypothetical protein